MNRFLPRILLSFALMVVVSPVWAKSINEGIIAIVGSDAITLKDLRQYIAGIYSQLKVEHKTPLEIQEIMAAYEDKGIDQLIEDRLILAAGNEKGLEIRPEAVDKKIKEIRDRYTTEDEFLGVLNAQGLTLGDVKRKLIDQMKAKFTVDLEVRQKVFVNPQDVTKYYEAHRGGFNRKARVNLESIYISFEKGKGEAYQLIKEIRLKLDAGEAFDALATGYSQAPSVGAIEMGQMVPEIEDAVFNLKLDEISKPVEVQGGVYLFKVAGKSTGKQETLAEVKDQIYGILFDEQFKTKFKEWIDKLRQKAYVEIRG